MRKVGHGFIAALASMTIVVAVVLVRYLVYKHNGKYIDIGNKIDTSKIIDDIDCLFMQDLINCVYDSYSYLHDICLPVIQDMLSIGKYTIVYLSSNKYDCVGIILENEEYINMYITEKLNVTCNIIDNLISKGVTGNINKYVNME